MNKVAMIGNNVNMQEHSNKERQSVLKQEIRLDLIFKSLTRNWRTYIIPLVVTFILSSLYIVQVPRYYTVSVMLAPENSNGNAMGGGLGSLASLAGVNLPSMNTGDAIVPTFYPDLMKSTDFIVPLFNTKVQTKDAQFNGTLVDYITKYKEASVVLKAIAWISNIIAPKDGGSLRREHGVYVVNSFSLNGTENDLFKLIAGMINCSVDEKTDVISINVTDQDPLVAALLADTVKNKLQEFITDYRTKKAKNDLSYYQKLCASAKLDYEKKQKIYADYVDANQNVVLATYQMQEQKLENEMQLSFNNYSQLKQQVQLAEAKVMERTPAFTTIQNSSVPIKPAGPKRMITVFSMMVLCMVVVSVYVIVRDKSLKF